MSDKPPVPIEDQIDILNKIIDNEGSCETDKWTASMLRDCTRCPLSKVHHPNNGNILSCFEAVGGHKKSTEEEIDAAYKDAALNALIDLQIRMSLSQDDNNIENTTDNKGNNERV